MQVTFYECAKRCIKPDRGFLKNFISNCEKKGGFIQNELCNLREAIGTCTTQEGMGYEMAYLHYGAEGKEKEVQVKASCALAKGKWEPFNLHTQLLQEIQQAHQKSSKELGTLKEIINYINKAVDSMPSQFYEYAPHFVTSRWTEWWNRKSRQAAFVDPNWVEVSMFRQLWNNLYYEGGGCGSIATLACVKKLGIKTTYDKIIAAYGSGKTKGVMEEQYYANRGFCFGKEKRFEDNCSTYRSLQKQLKQNWQINIIFYPPEKIKKSEQNKHGVPSHIEHLFSVSVESENQCFGITNSWAHPAIIFGGDGNFYHSNFEIYTGKEIEVKYRAYAFCEPEFCDTYDCRKSEAYQVEEILGFPKTEEASIRKIDQAFKQPLSALSLEEQWALLKRMNHLLYLNPSEENIDRALKMKNFMQDVSDNHQRVSEAIQELLNQPSLKERILKDCGYQGAFRYRPNDVAVKECGANYIKALCTYYKPYSEGTIIRTCDFNGPCQNLDEDNGRFYCSQP